MGGLNSQVLLYIDCIVIYAYSIYPVSLGGEVVRDVVSDFQHNTKRYHKTKHFSKYFRLAIYEILHYTVKPALKTTCI